MRTLIVIAVLLVAGCTSFSRVPGGERVAVKGVMTVQSDVAWNRFTPVGETTQPYNEIWTADGQLLNALTFFAGVVDGEPLMRRPEREEKLPAFRRDMTPTEVVELVEATVAKVVNAPLVSTRNLRPEKFGGVDGFRFELSYVGKDNVDREATAAGAIRNGKLYLVLYEGTRLHHYGLRRDQAERVIQSVQFVGS